MIKEWVGCIAWLAVSVAALGASAELQVMTRFGPGPGLFIKVLAFLMLALAVLQAAGLLMALRRTVLAKPTPEKPTTLLNTDENDDHFVVTRSGALRFAALMATIFAYGLLLEPVGFFVATVGLTFMSLVLLGRSPRRSMLEAVIAILVAWLVFGQLLGVNLPRATFAPLSDFGL